MTIQEQIEQYLDHSGDLGYIDAVLTSVDLNTLFGVITEMLQSGDIERILNTNLFIRDVLLNFGLGDKAHSFHENFYTSPVVDAINKNVFVPLFEVRASSIYTIGKIGLRSSIGLLNDAFSYFLERDPFLLSDLLFELRWLGDPYTWDRIDQMARSDSPITRWAIFSTSFFDHFDIAQNEDKATHIRLQSHYLELLTMDGYRLLRQEAEYRLREYEFAQIARSLSKPDRKKARKALELEQPPVTFFTINRRFHLYLGEIKKPDYSLAEVEDFVLRFSKA